MDLYQIFIKVKKIFKSIKKPYKYVPPCPMCGSCETGRFIKPSSSQEIDEKILCEALAGGELVEITPVHDKKINAFCMTCNFEWRAYIEDKWLTDDEIEIERKKRNTNLYLRSRRNEQIRRRQEQHAKLPSLTGFLGFYDK